MSRQIYTLANSSCSVGPRSAGLAVRFGSIVSIRIGGWLLQTGKQQDDKPRRTVLLFNETPNFFEYSSSNPAPREYRITKKSRVGARRLITSRPVITTEFRRKECGLHLLPGREQAADSVYFFSGSAVRSAVQHRRSMQQCVTNTSLFPRTVPNRLPPCAIPKTHGWPRFGF